MNKKTVVRTCHVTFFFSALLLILFQSLDLGFDTNVQAKTTMAKSGDDFVERIQGMAHIHLPNSSYTRNWDRMNDNLGKLGIRYLRRVYTPNLATQDNIERHHYLHDKYGIRYQFQVNYGFSNKEKNTWNKTQLRQNLQAIKRDFPVEMIARLEGPNEAPFKTKKERMVIINYQRELYKMVKEDATLRQFPVVCFSTVNLGGLNLFENLYEICDVGNVHSYPAYRSPANFINNLQKKFTNSKAYPVSNNNLMAITEEAYGDKATRFPHTMHRNANVQAKYEQRLLLLQYQADMAIVGRSQLADAKPDNQGNRFSYIGYLKYDGTPKPVYYAIKNLLSLLGEAKWDINNQKWIYPPDFKPDSLNYELFGDTAKTKQILFQKSDGRFFLVLWQEEEGWDTETNKEVKVPSQNLTLQLNTPIESAKVWLPYTPDNPSTTMKPILINKYPSKLSLSVPDYPLIVELKPK